MRRSVTLLVALAAIPGCRSPDGYGVAVEASKGDGEYGRADWDTETYTVAPFVEWDAGERRASRLEERDWRADASQEILQLRHELALSREAGRKAGSTPSKGESDSLVSNVLSGEVDEATVVRVIWWAVAALVLAIVAGILGVPIPGLAKRKEPH